MNVLTTTSGGPGEILTLLTQQGDAVPAQLQPDSSIAGSATPLSSVLYVDGNNAGTATPTGSIEAPFRTVQAAIDASAALSQVTIYIAPGTYAESPAIAAATQNVNFVGMTSGFGFFDDTPTEIDPVTITGTLSGAGSDIGLENLSVAAVNAGAGTVMLRNARLTNNALNLLAGGVIASADPELTNYRLRANVGSGIITSKGYQIFEAICGALDVTQSPGGMQTITLGAAQPSRFTLADFNGATTIDPAAIVQMDLYSYESALRAGVALPLTTTVTGPGLLIHQDFDSTASPVDQTLLPANHAPGLYTVGFACTVTAAGAHTLTPTVRGVGEGGASFAIGNNPAWAPIDTSAPKTVGFAPITVFSDGTTALVLRWTWDSTGGDIAQVSTDASALLQGS